MPSAKGTDNGCRVRRIAAGEIETAVIDQARALLAAGEKLDRGYLGKILMLTLLAPAIMEAILDGRQPAEFGVHVLRQGVPVEWGEQRNAAELHPMSPSRLR